MTKLPDIGPQAIGRPGEFYAVYLPEGGAVTLTGLIASLPYRWFDPRAGEFHADGTAGAGAPTLTAPSGHPWVLIAGRRRP